MSDLENDPQYPNTSHESDFVDADSSENPDALPVEESGSTAPFVDPPLPEFDTGSLESPPAEASQVPLKVSPATASDLNDLFSTESSQDETGLEQPLLAPTYKVSPAETVSPYGVASSDEAEPVDESPSTWQTTWAIVREVGETIILTLIIFFLIQLFIRNFRVVGTSMVNNLHDGQYLIIDKVTYNPFLRESVGIGGPNRGDVIVFKPPRNPDDDYVKRVIGLPGEKVQVIQGQVYIDDQLLAEPFQPVVGTYSMPAAVVVPEGEVFVLGDNRNNSNDSHNWGPLPLENIVGRAWLSYWPPDQWGTIPRDVPSEEATLWHFVGRFIPAANAQNE